MYELTVLDPTIAGPTVSPKPAPRLRNFEGKTIGALWNGRPQEDAVLQGILDHIAREYPVKGVRMWRKPQLYISAPDDMVDEIVSETDAVITGVGT